jgi:hypothetical protein
MGGSSGSYTIITWTFLVNQPDASGNLLPVSVQMRGVRIDGAVHDGDEVEVSSGTWNNGTLNTRRVLNTKTGQEVIAMGLLGAYRGAYIATGIVLLLILVAVGVFGLHIFSGGGAGDTGGGAGVPTLPLTPLAFQSDTQAIKCSGSAFQVTLENQNDRAVQWRVDRTTQEGGQNWASVSPTSGTIGANQNAAITITPTANLCNRFQGSIDTVFVFVATLDSSTHQPIAEETQIPILVRTF